ncbi:MAG: hypothetical protein WA160_06920 [Pseudobdellovibrio sp.]
MKSVKTKIIQTIGFVSMFFAAEYAHAANFFGGLKSLIDFGVKTAGYLSVGSFIIAGCMYFADKNRGSEKLSGAITGTVIVGSAVGLSGLIIGMFS